MDTIANESKARVIYHHIVALLERNLLRLCYCIAFIDLAQALGFLINSIAIMNTDRDDYYSIAAIFGSMFWVLLAFLLMYGLYESHLTFVFAWLVFSVIGVFLDILLFMWTISVFEGIHWSEVLEFMLLYFGIVTEWLFVFVVRKYYLILKAEKANYNQVEEGKVNHSNELTALHPGKGDASRASKTSKLNSNTNKQ